MNDKKEKFIKAGLIALFSIFSLLFTSFLIFVIERQINSNYYRCQDLLGNAIYCTIWSYANGTVLPTDLQTLNSCIIEEFLCCPKSAESAARKDFGYCYIFWPSGFKGTPPDYPLMYDKRLSNHKGEGIFILQVTGDESRKGDVFFDKNAEWLQKFALSHPEYEIPMPEDLPRKAEIEAKISKLREKGNIRIHNVPKKSETSPTASGKTEREEVREP